jgi:hypothetical protein
VFSTLPTDYLLWLQEMRAEDEALAIDSILNGETLSAEPS